MEGWFCSVLFSFLYSIVKSGRTIRERISSYSCEATNAAGTTDKNFVLRLTGKLFVEEERFVARKTWQIGGRLDRNGDSDRNCHGSSQKLSRRVEYERIGGGGEVKAWGTLGTAVRDYS